ncbi:Mrgprh: Mas-related G-protein coupled receptor member H [Crotalus adamanteus]|uniref:Mrgprh: Mas-related G-protein coupled receptor member H n=1 Tax=Crotalus adamanteus TaxID=8729 RepID=A0AAW1BM51_CROAD
MKYVFSWDVIPRLHLLVTALLCLPLISISSVILFITINLRSKQIKRGRLLLMILITLFCFLILSVLLYVSIFVDHFVDMSYVWDYLSFPFYFSLSACLNSSINPVIYFLGGRKKRTQSRESIKVLFQRVFGEDLANMNATADYLDDSTTRILPEHQIISNYFKNIIVSIGLIISCIGAPLNGIVIWLLGFQIKRNPFTVLILNLAIADFGFLIFMIISCINIFIGFRQSGILQIIFYSLFNVTYINGLFLLTAISIDRCVSVLFPIWHRCSRPKYLSPAVCAILWIFSFFLLGISSILGDKTLYSPHLVVTAVLCLPLITTSTVILFIKICLKSKQLKCGRILVMILITLFCFLILTLPLYISLPIIHFIQKWYLIDFIKLPFYFSLCASLNCSVNPVIYFLVGRKKKAHSRESIKVIFQRIFREEEAPEI